MGKKKIVIWSVVAVLIAAGVAAGLILFLRGRSGESGSDDVYVESVASLMGTDSGTVNRFSGVVEPQKTWEVKKNVEQTVKEIYVQEGDSVSEGTPLFAYETDTLQNELAQAKLELESITNEISDYRNQITVLTAERDAASNDEKFQYTTQIQTVQTQIKQSEYNLESKKVEISNKEKAIANAVVTSEINGTVKSISESGTDSYTGEETAFITILATGEFLVKGTVNEQNIYELSEGVAVLLRSRVDETQIWSGTVKSIDTSSTSQSTDNDSSSGEQASNYTFYVTPADQAGLFLGQHVYIEPDQGQNTSEDGVRIYAGYIVTEEEEPYVWADNGKNRLKKQTVTLGEYDEETDCYEITAGLTKDDRIAFPVEGLKEGAHTVRDNTEVTE